MGEQNEMKKIDFVSLGFCSNDYLAVVPQIPIDDKVQMTAHLVQGGGPAATSAVAAARLGVSAAFCGTVGDDDPGKKIRRDFEMEKVDVRNLVTRCRRTSPIAYCWIDQPTGKRSVVWTRGNLEEMTPEEVDFDLIRQAKMLHIDGHQPQAALAAGG